MIQEYLFSTDDKKNQIENKQLPDGVEQEIETIENSSNWILRYSMEGENEKTAKVLSRLNSDIVNTYNPLVLSNGCSAYYNKSLFPDINEFERKLRKLLYLASRLSENKEYITIIKDLEAKDFGEIFTLLFIDTNFVNNVKTKVNGQKGSSGSFTRKEIIEIIQNIEEKTLWDELLQYECVPTLRKKFYEIKAYRNDVMHAHNMDYMGFNDARKLFRSANEEFDTAIGELIGAKEDNIPTFVVKDFNKILGNALQNQIDFSGLSDALSALYPPEIRDKWQNLGKVLNEQTKLSLGKYRIKPEIADALSNIGKLAALQPDILPMQNALSDLAQRLNQYKIDIPPEISDFQKKLSDIDISSIADEGIDEEDGKDDDNE